jgi:hypothetical protein
MKKFYYIFIVLAVCQSGCLFHDNAPEGDNSPVFVQYKFSSQNQENYTLSLAPTQITQDLKTIKTLFTHLDMQNQTILPIAQKALANTSAQPECINVNQMNSEGMFKDMLNNADGLTDINLSWTTSNGKPVVLCQNEANPYEKLDNSLLLVSAAMKKENISGAVKMNYFLDVLQNAGKIEGMELHFSAHIAAMVMGAFDVECVISGKIAVSMNLGQSLTGDITMEFSILEDRYRGSVALSFNAGTGAAQLIPNIESCQITHNYQNVGSLDLSQPVPVIQDIYGYPIH